jgi:hypothetical protein
MPSTLDAIGIWFHRLTVLLPAGHQISIAVNRGGPFWFPTQCCLKMVSHPAFGSRAQLSDKCRRPGDVGRIYESAARKGPPR